jgi:hypothetical protein
MRQTDTVDKPISAGTGKHHNALGWSGLYGTEQIKKLSENSPYLRPKNQCLN